MITNFAIASQIANQRRADRLREAHHARHARVALRRDRTARDYPIRIRGGAARIATAT